MASKNQGPKRHRGDDVVRKQLERTVLDGRMVTVNIHNVGPIEGYVCGMDAYHIFVITPDGEKHLVHKSAPLITLHDESTFESEPNHTSLEDVVGPFRSFLQRQMNGQPTAVGSRAS